jgi:transcriptional regulator with XRE-family HTH domain
MTAGKKLKAPERFIQLLKKAMDDHPDKLSLREVARRADISPAYLSYLLSGERGVPSNDAIAQLEEVLDITEGKLFAAAARPDDQALEFFRRDEAAPILRTLAEVPKEDLSTVRKMIEAFVERRAKRK